MTALSQQNNKLKSLCVDVLWCKYTVNNNTNLQTCAETMQQILVCSLTLSIHAMHTMDSCLVDTNTSRNDP